MKILIVTLALFVLIGCNNSQNENAVLKDRIEVLESKIANTYKPGLGEFMSNILAHHAKLWFAGSNQNWKLADFEINEILESIEDIQTYQNERKETNLITIIFPAIDSVKLAIKKQNLSFFNRSYSLLTNTCNNCHRSAAFEFNVVKIPDVNPFSNQDFRLSK